MWTRPSALTRITTWQAGSATSSRPLASRVTPYGPEIAVDVASPPSTAPQRSSPVPNSGRIGPVRADDPDAVALALGDDERAVAGQREVRDVLQGRSDRRAAIAAAAEAAGPGDRRDPSGRVDPSDAGVVLVGDEEGAAAQGQDPERTVQLCLGRRPAVAGSTRPGPSR